MGNPAGVRRDFTALEQRRLRAARLLEKGVHQSEVARQTGVHRQSVSRWAQQLETEGRAGLKQAGRAGRKPRLSTEDVERIERGLKRGPESRVPPGTRMAHSSAIGLELSAADGAGAGT